MVGIMDDDDDVPLFVVFDALDNVKTSSLLLVPLPPPPAALLAVIPGGGVVIGRDAALGCNGRAQALVAVAAAAGILADVVVVAVVASNLTKTNSKN